MPDLSGQWNGTFTYPANLGPATPFLLDMRDLNGALSGQIIEPEQFYGAMVTLNAVLFGVRSGRTVDFTKKYIDPPDGYEYPVDYVGRLSADGLIVSGVWSLPGADGSFEMHRDLAAPQSAVQREAVVD